MSIKTKPKPDDSDPYVEVKIFVEKSVVDACGGLDSAKLIAYWALVDESEKGVTSDDDKPVLN